MSDPVLWGGTIFDLTISELNNRSCPKEFRWWSVPMTSDIMLGEDSRWCPLTTATSYQLLAAIVRSCTWDFTKWLEMTQGVCVCLAIKSKLWDLETLTQSQVQTRHIIIAKPDIYSKIMNSDRAWQVLLLLGCLQHTTEYLVHVPVLGSPTLVRKRFLFRGWILRSW